MAEASQGGQPGALRRRKAPGAKPRLTSQQKAQIPELLRRGPEAFGFRGDVWTRERVETVIRREFGVSYSHVHVGRILKELGWTHQKPVRRGRQRDEESIQRWQDEGWPELQKKVAAEGYKSLFVDESGFYLLPWPYGHTHLSDRRRFCATRLPVTICP